LLPLLDSLPGHPYQCSVNSLEATQATDPVKDQLLKRVHKKHVIDHEGKLSKIPHLTVHDLNKAEYAIIKVVQLQAFRKERDAIETGNMEIKKDSCIRKLYPCFDNRQTTTNSTF
jgi:hypothetical protein